MVTLATYPGDGIWWTGHVIAAGTAIAKLYVSGAVTPKASAYNVCVIQLDVLSESGLQSRLVHHLFYYLAFQGNFLLLESRMDQEHEARLTEFLCNP